MKAITRLCLLLFLVASNAGAQKHELGKVSLAELQEKVHPTDSSAVAAVLYSRGRTYFDYTANNGFTTITEVEMKIKIYKKEGYGFANGQVLFSTYNKDQTVNISKAVTYNLVNGQIEKTKLKSEGEFTEKINKIWSKKKIAMPNIKEGSVIEYAYTLKSPYINSEISWDFQKSIPVNYSEYQIQIPEYFKYNSHLKGTLAPLVETSNTAKNYTGTSNKTAIIVKSGQLGDRSNYDIAYQELTSTYKLSNIPAIKEEGYVNNIENYTSAITHELSSIKLPNSAFENYATDWESVAKKIYESPDFGEELSKKNYFEEDLRPIMASGTPEQKTDAIFDYVKLRMNWNKEDGYFCDGGLKKAYQDKTGNIAEINLMLVSMLRFAGLDANPVLLSTRENGISLYPTRTAFNYVIAGVKTAGGLLLLDATNKNMLPGMLPVHALNWAGRMIMSDGSSSLVDLMPAANSKETVNIMAVIDNAGRLSGKLRTQYTDYNAYLFRENAIGMAREDYLEKLEKKHGGIVISDYQISNEHELVKPVVESYSFTDDNRAEVIGDKIYFSPMLFFAEKANPFRQETREYPVDFTFPYQQKYNISIAIPEGYSVETVPPAAAFEIDDKIGDFKYSVSKSGSQLQLIFVLDINQPIVGAEYYDTLKGFFKEVVAKQNEKIILKKV